MMEVVIIICIESKKIVNQIFSLYVLLDHRFYQKWAVIHDPKDTRAGVKGFVKCNISVIARGDVMSSLPTTSTSQNEDIEK